MTEEQAHNKERWSSIEVTQNAKRSYSFKVKLYFESDVVATGVVQEIEDIYGELHAKFPNKKREYD